MSELESGQDQIQSAEAQKLTAKATELIDTIQNNEFDFSESNVESDGFPENKKVYIFDMVVSERITDRKSRVSLVKEVKAERDERGNLLEVRDVTLIDSDSNSGLTNFGLPVVLSPGEASEILGLEKITTGIRSVHNIYANERGPVLTQVHEALFLFGAGEIIKVETVNDHDKDKAVMKGQFNNLAPATMSASDYEFVGGTLENLSYQIETLKKTSA